MKKSCILLFVLIFLLLLTSCDRNENPSIVGVSATFYDEVTDTPDTEEQSDRMVTVPTETALSVPLPDEELPPPYTRIEESESYKKEYTDGEWAEIMAAVPDDRYIQYPGLQARPLTATLYKDQKQIELNVNDPRLVKLINFYNNMIYHGIYAYTQGSYAPSEIEKIKGAEFRLELTYMTFPIDESFENNFGLFLVTNGTFVWVSADEKPPQAFGRDPLYACSREWLTLFGF